MLRPTFLTVLFYLLQLASPTTSQSDDYTIQISHKLATEKDYKLRYDMKKSVLPAGKYAITKHQIKSNFDISNLHEDTFTLSSFYDAAVRDGAASSDNRENAGSQDSAVSSLEQMSDLSHNELNFDDIYKIKVSLPNGKTHQTWVSYSSLIRSCFHDNIDLFLSDDGSYITGINYHASKPKDSCKPAKMTDKQRTSPHFVTTVRVLPSITSTGVDSDRWLMQFEQEQVKKEQEKDQPQSFLGKYWLYIVIGLVVMMSQGALAG